MYANSIQVNGSFKETPIMLSILLKATLANRIHPFSVYVPIKQEEKEPIRNYHKVKAKKFLWKKLLLTVIIFAFLWTLTCR